MKSEREGAGCALGPAGLMHCAARSCAAWQRADPPAARPTAPHRSHLASTASGAGSRLLAAPAAPCCIAACAALRLPSAGLSSMAASWRPAASTVLAASLTSSSCRQGGRPTRVTNRQAQLFSRAMWQSREEARREAALALCTRAGRTGQTSGGVAGRGGQAHLHIRRPRGEDGAQHLPGGGVDERPRGLLLSLLRGTPCCRLQGRRSGASSGAGLGQPVHCEALHPAQQQLKALQAQLVAPAKQDLLQGQGRGGRATTGVGRCKQSCTCCQRGLPICSPLVDKASVRNHLQRAPAP